MSQFLEFLRVCWKRGITISFEIYTKLSTSQPYLTPDSVPNAISMLKVFSRVFGHLCFILKCLSLKRGIILSKNYEICSKEDQPCFLQTRTVCHISSALPIFHHIVNFLTTKKQTKFSSANFQKKMLCPSYIILRIQRLLVILEREKLCLIAE